MGRQDVSDILRIKQCKTPTSSVDPARLGVFIAGGDATTATMGDGACEGAIAGEDEENGIVSDLAAVGGGAVLVGVGKLAVFAMEGGGITGAGAEVEGSAEGGDCVLEKTAPFSRLTRLGMTGFPAKNSPAETAGSSEGAGGKMSDWKLSA